MSTLCIDVGGSRIRATVLDASDSLRSWQRKRIVAARSLGWLNETLPRLLSPSSPAHLAERVGLPFEDIAVAVPGLVSDGEFLRTDLGIPRDLAAAFTRASGIPTLVIGDASAWAIGSVAYAMLSGRGVSFPAVVLALGTGIGCAIAVDEVRALPVEISTWPLRFGLLEAASNRAIEEPWQAHEMVGNRFIQWVASDKPHWSFERVRQEYTRRISALVGDLVPTLVERHGEVRSLVLGGGNVDLIDVRDLNVTLDVVTWDRATTQIDPDLIPLIGLQHACHR